jgi:hypothetical protein
MGQYYKIVNKTKKEYLDPHTFGNGVKLMEFVSDGRGVLQALGILLAEGNGRGGGDLRSDNKLIGSWAGDKVYVSGDYAESELYWKAEKYKDISIDVYCCLCEDSWYKKEIEKDLTNRIKSDRYFFTDGEREFIKRALPSVHGILDAKERGLL